MNILPHLVCSEIPISNSCRCSRTSIKNYNYIFINRCIYIDVGLTPARGRIVAEGKASDGVRYAGARSGVGRRVSGRYETKAIQ